MTVSRLFSNVMLSVVLLVLTASSHAGEEEFIDSYNQAVRDYRLVEAQEILKEGMAQYPNSSLFPLQLVSLKAAIRSFVGQQWRMVGEYRDSQPGRAWRACQRILKVDPSHAPAAELSLTLRALADKDLAVALAEAETAIVQNRFNDLREALGRAIVIDPESEQVRSLIRHAQEKMEENSRKATETAAKQWAVLEKKRANPGKGSETPRVSVAELKESLKTALAARPGDPEALSIARRAQATLTTSSDPKVRTAANEIAQIAATSADDTGTLLDKGKRLLAAGQFEQAQSLFERVARSNQFVHVAQGYLHVGLAILVRANPANVMEFPSLRLKALAAFQNALRFDHQLTLPKGYARFDEAFVAARQMV